MSTSSHKVGSAAAWLASNGVSAASVIDRVLISLGLKNDAELCRHLGVSKTTVSSWRGRNRIPYEEIHRMHLQGKLDISYCLTGIPGKIVDDDQGRRIVIASLKHVNALYPSPLFDEIIAKGEAALTEAPPTEK